MLVRFILTGRLIQELLQFQKERIYINDDVFKQVKYQVRFEWGIRRGTGCLRNAFAVSDLIKRHCPDNVISVIAFGEQ